MLFHRFAHAFLYSAFLGVVIYCYIKFGFQNSAILHSSNPQILHMTNNVTGVSSSSTFQSVLSNNATILTFGDSLTHGFLDMYGRSHSYALMLQKELPNSNVVESGQNGEMAVEMRERLVDNLLRYDPSVVAILAGTNDILRRIPSHIIINAITSLHDAAKEYSLAHDNSLRLTLCLTIPRCYPDERNTTYRHEINSALRSYASNSNGFTEIIDIGEVLDTYNVTNRRYWNADGLHLSAAGYDMVGKMVAEKLRSIDNHKRMSIT